jgi:uncharacterized protein YjdB
MGIVLTGALLVLGACENLTGEDGTVSLTGISLDPSSLNLAVEGDPVTLRVTYTPANTTQTGVRWSSDTPAVATVSNNGTVTPVSVGTATITATSTANSAITATCTVTVTTEAVSLAGISLDPSSLNLAVEGDPVTLRVTYTPANTTQTGVTWSSSDPAVAEVSNGMVNPKSAGDATITATSTADSTITATCTVTVTTETVPGETIPLTGISLPSALTLGAGSDFILSVTYTPANTTQTGVRWSSDTPAVAEVSNGTVTPKSAGTATITATSTADSTITASCTVTVQTSFTGAGLNIVFEGLEDQTVTLAITKDKLEQFVITAPDGFDRYLWYMDSVFMGETPKPTVTYSIYYVEPGRHYITVIVDEGGYHFSKTLAYTVGY